MKLLGSFLALLCALLYGTVFLQQPNGPRGLISQTIHYFSRPNTGTLNDIAVQRLKRSESAWRGKDLSTQDWRVVLTKQQVADAIAAVEIAERTLLGRNASLASMDRAEFPLGQALAAVVEDSKRQLRGVDGRGFVVLRGLPLDQWSNRQVEVFFWGLGLHLGIPGAQNNAGDLLGHVLDLGGDPKKDRQFITNVKIDLHCDAADVVGLLCLHPSRPGEGLSTLVSSVAVLTTLWDERPDLVEVLQERRFHVDTRGSGGINYITLPAIAYDNTGQLRTFWHTEYFRSWKQHADAPKSTDELAMVALDEWDKIAARPEYQLQMELQRGDIQLVNNHVVVHARTAYDDKGREHQRHLLRLWLSLDENEEGMSFVNKASKFVSKLRVLGSFIGGKVRRRIYCTEKEQNHG